MTGMDAVRIRGLQERILKLKAEKGAVILGHYYIPGEVQDVCDYLGDSLGLSRTAAGTDAPIIVFCGVHFMAETASILAQDRCVLLPALEAGCSLAESVTGAEVAAWRESHPGGVVISYVNTTAEVKAETDCCCTSANAVAVVEAYRDAPAILFLPDGNLGRYVMARTGIPMEIWDGACHVHTFFTRELLQRRMAEYPFAQVLVHPESPAASRKGIINNPRVFIGSTTGMIRRVAESEAEQFIVVTEEGVMHRMRQVAPGKELIRVTPDPICHHMKHNTLDRLLLCLENEAPRVQVPRDLAERAVRPIERMMQFG